MTKNINNIQETEYEIPYHYLIKDKQLLSFPQKLINCSIYIKYLEAIASKLEPFLGQKILDAGCGDGRFLNMLESKQVNAILSGADYSERAIGFAKVINTQVDFNICDLTKNLPFDRGSFDQVVLIETLEHIEPDRVDKVLEEISQILTDNGVLIITVPHSNRKLDKKHYQHFDSHGLSSVLKHHFSVKNMTGFHKVSLIKNLIFNFLTIIYYFLYPLKKLKLNFIVDGVSKFGFYYFSNFLQNCGIDEGYALICVAIKK